MQGAATRVDFYILDASEPQARLRFACRLAEKAYALKNRVYAHVADSATAQTLDELLWTFRDGSFVPHEQVIPGKAAVAPVTVGISGPAAEADLLINMGADVPDFFASFARVAEILNDSEASREAGRQRYRIYRDHGCTLETHRIT